MSNKYHGISSKPASSKPVSLGMSRNMIHNQNVGVDLVLSHCVSHSELILSFGTTTDGPQFICLSAGDTTVPGDVVTIHKCQLLLVTGLQDSSSKKTSDSKDI